MAARPISETRRKNSAGSTNDELRMCDTTFSFGQRGNHFFQSPSGREYTRLPQKLATLLSSAQVQKVHHVTLGYENSFLLTWRDNRGHDHIDSHGLPTELIEFVYATNTQGALIRSVSNIRVTLGPYNTSFFATDGSAYLWMNLPEDLLSALQLRIKNGNWIDKPRTVALGANKDFLLITEKNAAVWNLSHYIILSKMLDFSRSQKNGIEEVKNVVLHAYRYQCFIAESRNGTLLHDNLPPHEVADLEVMKVAILKEAQDKQRQGAEKVRQREEERRKVVERMKSPELRGIKLKRPELKERASLKREWGQGDVKQEFTATTKGGGLKLSLSLSISAKGIGLGLR